MSKRGRRETTAWPLDDRMNVVLFAGMGGACDGLEAAGFPVHLAINHNEIAIAVHQHRHPHTRHLQTDVFEVEVRPTIGKRRIGILWGSPDCRHFSNAKGRAPVSKRVRSLPWVICRWAGQGQPEVIGLENVPEIKTWGPLIARRDPATGRVIKLDGTVAAKGERVRVWDQQLIPDPKRKGKTWAAFKKHLHGLGYSFETRTLVCADFNDIATIRKREWGIGHRDGSPVIWPARTNAPRSKARATCADGARHQRAAISEEQAMTDVQKGKVRTWLVVYTAAGDEIEVAKRLRAKGYVDFCPLDRFRNRRRRPNSKATVPVWQDRAHYRRYVFVGIREGQSDDIGCILSTRGVSTVIHRFEQPWTVAPEVMRKLMKLVDAQGYMHRLDIALPEGTQVRLDADIPFSSFVARVAVDAGKEVSILLGVLGAERRIVVPRDAIAEIV